ncbi:TPA: hypothetical protein ACV1O4_002955 [Yersinia enterocolitica]|nr:hypothetical protein [Yersinia enterocolitica]HDL6661393.1 hypothetical protein [Yersinia enterocolitica]HDL6665593.1 hypothetical protein [Yersinia enterocolitica]HDL6712611.1 hypothetical protein [Yersinia enterocolitica]HDL6756020.1 hypothetical protein [Yersinia enterocolitica]
MPITYEIKFINENIETKKVTLENDSTTPYLDAIEDVLVQDFRLGATGIKLKNPTPIEKITNKYSIKSIKESTDIHGNVTERYVYPI